MRCILLIVLWTSVHAASPVQANDAHCAAAKEQLVRDDFVGAYDALKASWSMVTTPACIYNFGMAALNSKHYADAANAFEKIARSNPSDIEASYLWALATDWNCNVASTNEAVRTKCRDNSNLAGVLTVGLRNTKVVKELIHKGWGSELARQAQLFVGPGSSVQIYELHLAWKDNDAIAWLNYAGALDASMQPKEALAALEHALRLDPSAISSAYGFEHLISIFSRLKEHGKLVSLYERDATPFVQQIWPLYHVGLAYLGLNQLTKSRAILEKQEELLRAQLPPRRWRLSMTAALQGDVALMQGQTQSAIRAYQRAVTANDDDQSVRRAKRTIERLDSK